LIKKIEVATAFLAIEILLSAGLCRVQSRMPVSASAPVRSWTLELEGWSVKSRSAAGRKLMPVQRQASVSSL